MKGEDVKGGKGEKAKRRKGEKPEESYSLSSFPSSPFNPFPFSPLPPFSTSPFPVVNVAGITVANLDQDEVVEMVDGLVRRGGSHYLAVVNAAKVVRANRDEALRRVLEGADLVTADGMSVVWAARLLGAPLKERVTGIDLFERLVEHAARRNLSVYFLGACDEAVGGVVRRFTSLHPALRVAGYRNGYFTDSESDGVVEAIRRSCADLLFVAMGSPAQERWIAANVGRTGARLALGVGGSFDHLSGLKRRAPLWMQKAGLEWLYRLAREPRRLWRRYLVGNAEFIRLVVKQRLGL